MNFYIVASKVKHLKCFIAFQTTQSTDVIALEMQLSKICKTL
jgi:hypothetical protein